MPVYGYARVSTDDQCLENQIETLEAAGASTVRKETVSATSRDNRVELQIILDFLQEGDTLLVTRIDRLARSMKDLLDIAEEIKNKGATLRTTEQSFDTGDIYGDMTMKLLGVFAEFETNLRKERQMEGIRRTQKNNPDKYKGKQKSIDRDRIIELRKQGLSPTQISREMGIGRASVYRIFKELEILELLTDQNHKT